MPFICAGLNILQRIIFSQNNWSFVWHSVTASMFHPPCRTTGRTICHVTVFCKCNFIDLTHTFSSKSYSSSFPHGATRLPLAEISSNFTLGIFIKFRETFRLLLQRDKNNSQKKTDALRRDLCILMTTLVLNVTTLVSLWARLLSRYSNWAAGLDGPASNPSEDEIFRPSRPALGPTQPPVQWAQGLSRA